MVKNMTHSHENKTTRWRWQQFVLPLSGVMWSVIGAATALIAQENSSVPALPDGSRVSQAQWADWHAQDAEGWAAYNIAREYHLSFLSSNKPEAAKKTYDYYSKSATAGYAQAQANLGYCYDKGLGTEENSVKAKRWYEEAAKQGNLVGQLNYAQKLLTDGINNEDRDDTLQARDWFQKVIGQNAELTEAAYGIGLTYVTLPGRTKEDLGKGRDWLLKAKDKHQALFALGWMDEQQGRHGTAIKLYQQAKALGSLSAAFNLGRCWENGIGTAVNKNKAIEEYLFAAKRGHAMSQFAIGLLKYDLGNKPADYIEVVMWWRLAERNGSNEAMDALRKIKLSRLLTRAEMEDGESRASALEQTIHANHKPSKATEYSYNREQASSNDRKPAHVFSGFFISNDGWILTSMDQFKVDPETNKLALGYSINVVTQAGSFPVDSEIVIDESHRYAVFKVDGKFNSLPLTSDPPKPNDEVTQAMDAVTITPQSTDSYITAKFKGQVEPVEDPDQAAYFTLLTSNPVERKYSNFLSYNALGQATGFALHGDQESNAKLKFLKSDTILEFLQNALKNAQLQSNDSATKPTEAALKDRVSQATAKILIYKD